MELNNEFRVGIPVEDAWVVLTDVEAIAPCMPGAQLTEADGDTYRGKIKIKVGPVTAQYKGEAKFVEKDEANGKAVLDASGSGSQGTASAMITAVLTADGDGTKVNVNTDLKITGRLASLARGSVINDISAKLLGEFTDCLEAKLEAGDLGAGGPAAEEPVADAPTEAAAEDAPTESAAPETGSGFRKIDSPEVEALDAGDFLPPQVKAAAPAALILLILLLIFRRRR